MKMNQILLLTMSCFLVGLTACSEKSSNKEVSTAAAVQPAADASSEDTTAAAALPVSGVAMGESNIASHTVVPGQSSSGAPAMTIEEIFVAYPTLAERDAWLATIDKVVETDARTFDLYAGSVLVLSLARGTDANSLVVSQSSNGFAADVITYSMIGNPEDQSEAVGTLFFQMSACKAGIPEQEQEQGQDKGQDKEPKPVADVCHSIEATLTLEKVIQKPEGDQDQGKGKEEEQEHEQTKP